MWINGVKQEHVPALDRSFQYGDGCFTTIQTQFGELRHWELHVERMQACLNTLGIATPPWRDIKHQLMDIALDDPIAGVKLLISRGSGGRGYASPHNAHSLIMSNHFAYPQHYPQWQTDGIKLGISRIKLGHNPLLAGHKHNNRLEQVLVKNDLDAQQVDDGVVLDINEHIVETSSANIFWRKGSTLYTPILDKAGVAGIIRRLIIQDAEPLGFKALLGRFDLVDLHDADEVFVSNALLGVAPVVQVGERRYPIGELTLKLQKRV
ncbi:4-amino-4-deoxychorismate lyase [Vibrio sp. qd031]|uniref:aminodeoxychorismate lyase n=1 Tax=Vibrio sp. qd031 TaxID=1603038 RepID=UPI000A0F6674|nr:aminodeoxychorismate lyase [Vibrio sp. qd031]ORT50333.1 4-amino-4-deoxychorismate lyase [Vibrio sp. qd031]